MVVTYDDAIKTLAQWHKNSEANVSAIYVFSDPEKKVIRLIEVTDVVPETGELYVFEFGATDDIPYRSAIAQVTPNEWACIQNGEIPLPDGWEINERKEVVV